PEVRTWEADDERVLFAEADGLAVELDRIDDGVRHAESPRARLVRRPLVRLLELPRRLKDRDLVVARLEDAFRAQVLVQHVERLGDSRAVHRDGARPGTRAGT